MQKTVEFRRRAKLIGWILFTAGIVNLVINLNDVRSISIAGHVNQEVLDKAGPAALKLASEIKELRDSILLNRMINIAVLVIEIWVAKGLINATDKETNPYDAIRLSKRLRFWSIYSAVICVIITLGQEYEPDMLNSDLVVIIIEQIPDLSIRGFACYIVHRYIQYLKQDSFLSNEYKSYSYSSFRRKHRLLIFH